MASPNAARSRATAHVGLAIGHDSLTAVEVRGALGGPRPGRTWTWPLARTTAEGGVPALADALAALRGSLDAPRVTASVAFLHPLAQVKAVAVPPLRRGALRSLLARNARRYFVGGADAVIVDALPLRGRGSAPRGAATAVCAAEPVVEATLATIAAAGFAVDRATAGAVALQEAVAALAPGARQGRVVLAVSSRQWAEVILLDAGTLRLAHPAPGLASARAPELARAIADAVARMAAVGLRPERAMVLDDASQDAAGDPVALAAATLLDGRPQSLEREPAPEGYGPAALAAFGAALVGESSPLLLSGGLRTTRQRAARRRTVAVSACAAATLCLAGAAHLVGLRRELSAIEAKRGAIAPAVSQAMTLRRSVETTRATLETIAGLERTAPRWTDALSALAAALPDSAYLVSVAAEGTQIRLSGAAVSGGAVVPALEASPFFSRVTLAAPLRRDDADDLEHFELTTVLTVGGASSASAGEDLR
ncbi:MAG TPA: PilN domain-containing protein [Gemmatimonadaceae bacterium]|nr:PilN domain-containing protein [Gemmatimonadaceae bacterium]